MFGRLLFLASPIVLTSAIAAQPRRALVVSQDGAGQFTSIAAALESVKDASAQNPVDVVIKPGSSWEI